MRFSVGSALRRCALRCALALLAACATTMARAEISATDVVGRTVRLEKPARRVVLAQGRQLPALALLTPDPSEVLVGMGGEWKRQDAESYARYKAAFPRLEEVAIVAAGSAESMSVEKIVALEPDLVVLSRNLAGKLEGGASDVIRRLESAGIAVVVVDFYVHPLQDTAPGLLALGRLLGREAQAKAYVDFYNEHVGAVRKRLEGIVGQRPSVFIQTHAGATPCCYTAGAGAFSDLIAAAGARSLGASLLTGLSGQISPERLLGEEIDLFVATGGTYQEKQGGLVLGAGVAPETARESLRKALAQSPQSELGPVRAGRAYGLWQLFNDTPMNVLALEALAKWSRPQLFGDLRPEETLKQINERFLAVPMQGAFWTAP